MMNSWIDDFEDPDNEVIATMPKDSNERVCTFCNRIAVVVQLFGSMSVHMCEGHTSHE
jgi:hypothetical protein